MGDAERVNVGAAITVRVMGVALVRLPDVPEIESVTVPVEAVGTADSVRVLELVALAGLNVAVTPVSRPEAAMVTRPEKPFCGVTVIVLVPLAP